MPYLVQSTHLDGLGDQDAPGAGPRHRGRQQVGGPYGRARPADPAARRRARARSDRDRPGVPGRAHGPGEDQGDGVRGLPPRARRAPGGRAAAPGGPGHRGSGGAAEPGDARTQPPRVPRTRRCPGRCASLDRGGPPPAPPRSRCHPRPPCAGPVRNEQDGIPSRRPRCRGRRRFGPQRERGGECPQAQRPGDGRPRQRGGRSRGAP
jgi:hypothetical protein